jgi:hypothetical protein
MASMIDNEDIFSDTYIVSTSDKAITDAAIQMLNKIARAPFTRPAQLVTVAKALHVLSKIPQVAQAEISVHVSLDGPRRWFGEHEIWHWWTIDIENQFLQIEAGGHFYRESTGGDSFTSLIWNIRPGEQATYLDYLDQLQIVDDAQPFPQEVAGLDLTGPGFSLEVVDEDNPLLEEMEIDDEDEDEEPESEMKPKYEPVDESERRLQVHENLAEGVRRNDTYAGASEECDICGKPFSSRRFMVDGNRRGRGIEWACMCSDCFWREGEGIGYGKGQLYTRMDNDKWLMTGGFPPQETDSEF